MAHVEGEIRFESARADRRLAQLLNPRPRKGRPRRFGPDIAATVLADWRAGTAVADLLRRHGFAKATLYRLLREAARAEAERDALAAAASPPGQQ